MPTDEATRAVQVQAPFDEVLEVIRAVGEQAEWVPSIKESQVLTVGDDGLPQSAHFSATSPVGNDSYELSYEHLDDGLRWTMLSGRLQTGQEGHYALRALDEDSTEVTFTLTIHHLLPLPGFIRRKVINDLVNGTVQGLKEYLEAE